MSKRKPQAPFPMCLRGSEPTPADGPKPMKESKKDGRLLRWARPASGKRVRFCTRPGMAPRVITDPAECEGCTGRVVS